MQEVLATLLLVLVFAGVALAACYVRVLTSFFKELRHKEPDVWHSIGSPSLLNMLLMPFKNFKKYYAFLPILKARRYGDYKYAARAWVLLVAGLLYFILLLILVALQAVAVLT
jgi:hypothetical protein